METLAPKSSLFGVLMDFRSSLRGTDSEALDQVLHNMLGSQEVDIQALEMELAMLPPPPTSNIDASNGNMSPQEMANMLSELYGWTDEAQKEGEEAQQAKPRRGRPAGANGRAPKQRKQKGATPANPPVSSQTIFAANNNNAGLASGLASGSDRPQSGVGLDTDPTNGSEGCDADFWRTQLVALQASHAKALQDVKDSLKKEKNKSKRLEDEVERMKKRVHMSGQVRL